MGKPQYHVASFSGGKDSTAMVLRMIELGCKLDEVLFCDTTMEFPAMLRHVEKVKAVVEAAGIKFTVIRAEHDFEYYLLEHRPKRKNLRYEGVSGYSWPGPRERWCTSRLKTDVIRRYLRKLRETYNVVQYIGLAADERYRLDRKHNQAADMCHPLVEWGWTEANAMNYCRAKGYDWEGLYSLFDRVSCWCCPLQPLPELRKLYEQFPELWQKLKALDGQTFRQFKADYSVADLEKRFDLETALEGIGESTRNRAFHADLKKLLAGETTIDSILDERRAARE